MEQLRRRRLSTDLQTGLTGLGPRPAHNKSPLRIFTARKAELSCCSGLVFDQLYSCFIANSEQKWRKKQVRSSDQLKVDKISVGFDCCFFVVSIFRPFNVECFETAVRYYNPQQQQWVSMTVRRALSSLTFAGCIYSPSEFSFCADRV